ncbi:hypothetical protein BDW22DRAFT_1336833 [Trametopsis cervina]|nr:hypothetical protein BDW22DRAFT_1336833 [Trametopsis cervina]
MALPSPPLVSTGLQARTEPVFPDQPPSCPICAQNYDGLSSCAQAAPVLANFSMILFNPGAFIDVIKCACTDTFQSAYPQCVDCFIQTNQTAFLDADTQELPSVLQGLHSVCAVASTLIGNVSETDGEATPTHSPAVTPTSSSGAATNGGEFIASINPRVFLVALSVVLGIHFWI